MNRETERLLVDAREQVYTALAEMETEQPYSLHSTFPKGTQTGAAVIWGEYSNTATDCPVVDELVFQIDLWTPDGTSQQALSQAVNDAMTGLGLRRVYAGPDSWEDTGAGYRRKTFRFGRKVDKRTMRLID